MCGPSLVSSRGAASGWSSEWKRHRQAERAERAQCDVPPAVPDDLDDASVEKAAGVVELPLHVQWSGRRSYDLADRADRARVYELVLREGTEDDVRHFVRLDDLVELWDDLLLPVHVRATWGQWLADRRAARC